MTYDQLIALNAIIKAGSFKAASDLLHKSQPAISVSIKKLEEEFGLKIFSRDQYRPVLTPQGKAFFDRSQVVLSHTNALRTLGKQLALGHEPKIRIAIEATCPMHLTLEILKKFFKDYPHTKLDLLFEYIGGATERLLEDKADLALTPVFEPNPSIVLLFLNTTIMVPVVAPHFFVQGKSYKPNDEEMKEHVQTIIQDTSKVSPKKMGYLKDGNHWTVNNYLIQKQIIMSGLAWGFLPNHLIEDELKNKTLTQLKTKNIKPYRFAINVVRRSDQPIGPVTTKLWEYFQSTAKERSKHESPVVKKSNTKKKSKSSK